VSGKEIKLVMVLGSLRGSETGRDSVKAMATDWGWAMGCC
jgi:hypothetical protein